MNRRQILIRVLRGSATRKERKLLEKWLSSDAEFNSMEDGISNELDLTPTSADLTEIRRILESSRRRRTKSRLIVILTVIIVMSVVVAVLFSRTHGPQNLIFKNTDIQAVIAELETSFSVTIQTHNAHLVNCKVTSELYRVESVDEALNIISNATGLTWQKTDNTLYTITGYCNQ